MDGVTDSAFRFMTAKYSKPAVMMTEFTNVEGLARGAVKMLSAFKYSDIERPIVAQIYGVEVPSYYKAAVMLAEMGFDGIDINMGCPAKKVSESGAGAGLIRTPELAKEIIRSTQKGVEDWANGISLEEAGVHPNMIAEMPKWPKGERRMLPVSVKTRIGFGEVVVEEWIKHLLDERPANITVHGRTLKQMYMGLADWEAIAKAAALCKEAGVGVLGNGDVKSMDEAREKCEKYGVEGVLVGRATFGDPWFFGGLEPTIEERLKAAVEHSLEFEKQLPELHFHIIRKHLGWYAKGFDGAKEVRVEFMKADNAADVERAVENFFKRC